MSAACVGRADLIEELLKHPAFLNSAEIRSTNQHANKYMALMYAASETHTQSGAAVEALLKHPEFVNTVTRQDRHGDTALSLAAARGHTKVVNLFLPLQTEGTLKTQNLRGNNALMKAVQFKRLDTVKAILNSPFGPAIVNETRRIDGNTALQIALQIAQHFKYTEIIAALREAGAKESLNR